MTLTAEQIARAMKWGLCLSCGEKLTKYRANVVTPEMALTAITDRPQSHTYCARADAILPERDGAQIVFITRTPSVPHMGDGIASFRLPPPDAIEWYVDGRNAFRDEAIMAIKGVILTLLERCQEDETEFRNLGIRVSALVPTLPVRSSKNVRQCIDCSGATNDPTILGCTKIGCPLLGDERVANDG